VTTESAGGKYLDIVSEMMNRLRDDQWPHIRAAAELVAGALANGRDFHAFGSGHSHMLAEEVFYRAGGLVRVRPILSDKLMLHVDAAESTVLERQPGMADELLTSHPMQRGDVLLVASNSGSNAVASRLAQLARELGVGVIAITSLRHATSAEARPNDLPRLHELADVAIDNGGVVGDAAVDIEGFDRMVGPTSTVIGAAIVNAMVAEAVELMVRRGTPPDVYKSSNVEGGDAVNRGFLPTAGVPTATNSPFKIRGVIEGFYGQPWTHEQRLDMIDFISNRGMNTFAYAPKDDPLMRHNWRQPYEGAELARLSELAAACRDNAVDLLYCLSPGLSIRYSSADDVDALTRKLESVADLGVSFFGLLLDDIPPTLQQDADRAAFTDLVDAHISLTERVFGRFQTDQRLIVCPTQYWGRGDEDYISRLGAGIDPRIDIFWTGRAICSPTLDLSDAATFSRATNRPPTYWDNYPVNDVAMTNELHVGPYRGRDRHLYRFSNGVIANGMELFESSKIAFATISDYLRDPDGYEPEESWRRALRDVVGDDDMEAYALFADNVRSSALATDDAPIITAALAAFMFESEHGGGPVAASADLMRLSDQLLSAADHLLRGPVHNRALVDEARPWIQAFETGAQALHCMAELAATDRLSRDGLRELLPYLHRLRELRVRVFGDVVDMTLTEFTRGGTA